jgi:diacylglycerol kinase (ATP)
VSVEHSLLVITEPAMHTADGESVRVALDVLRASSQLKVVTPRGPQELHQVLDKRGRRRPVVVGGDEAMHGVVQTLYQRRELAGSLLGWVPISTRHDLARTLGIPPDPAGAARVVLTGAERWLDLLVDDAGGIAVNAVRVGAPPAVPNGTDAEPSPLDRLRSGLSSLVAGGRRSGWRLRVEADGTVLTDLDRRVLLVGLGNGSDVGGGALSAEVSPDDGLAEVVVSEASGPLAWLGQANRHRGEHVRQDGVRIVRARAVTVSGQDFPYDADGVTCGPVRLRTWTVQHSAWRLTVPAP